MAPTIADYAGFEAPAQWQGRSLWPVLEADDAAWRDAIFFDHGLYTAQRALRTERWKLIQTSHAGMWDGVVPETQLYDMDADPWEQTNLAEDRPKVVSRLDDRLQALVEDHRGEHPDTLDSVAERGPAGYLAFREAYDGVSTPGGQ
jgi:arylsulfatase A-like enzyme